MITKDPIDFSCNVNPLGIPREALKFLNSNLESSLSSYPDYQNKEALKSISKFYNLPEENLIVGNGSTDFFFGLPRALDIKTGMVIIPTFWEYNFSLKRSKSKVIYFKTKAKEGFKINFVDLEKTISSISQNGNTAVYFCNPNNPTSVLIDPKKILNLCKKFTKTIFIIDETYMLFRKDYYDLSLIGKVNYYSNLVIVTSFSKFFAIPGVRIGICASSKQNINSIQRNQIPYNVNTLAQNVIPFLLREKEFIESSRNYIDLEKKRVYNNFKEEINLQVYSPDANFILMELKGYREDSVALSKYLKKNGIIIREGKELWPLGSKFARFSIRKQEENDLLIKKIRDFLTH